MQALRRVSCSARPLASSLRSTSGSTTTLMTHRLALTGAQSFSSTSSNSSTAAASHDHGHGHGHGSTVKAPNGVSTGESIIPLSNIQAQWEAMTEEERSIVHQQLEELQTRDWRSMSLDEKRAAYYIAFGPHGTRVPSTKPGEANKVAIGVLAVIGATGILWTIIRSNAREPPRTMTKEWQAASNEKALEEKINPITGISSEGYKGKGYIQSK